ncbi:MAG: hypothetical protein AAGK14_07985 [Verrucomicrobiota bacterium]
MRMMYKFLIPNQKGDQTKLDGSLRKALKELVEETKPESAYFYMYHGKRGGLLVFDVEHPGDLVPINDKLIAATGAEINVHPTLNWEELEKTP